MTAAPASAATGLRAASWPRGRPLDERLLWIDPRESRLTDHVVRDLPRVLRAGDLLVVNDAATFPASLRATVANTSSAAAVEVRLTGRSSGDRWSAVLFGTGDWRTPTEHRPAPWLVREGDLLEFDDAFRASVVRVASESPRVVELEFSGTEVDAFWSHLYRVGRPVQYAYIRAPLDLAHVQTSFASRPWAAEMPCAARPLTWELVFELVRRGIAVTAVTHAAGLSSTGDEALDARLPFPEAFEIPDAAVRAVARARASGGRVVAVGTTVVRALEGCAAASGGELLARTGTTDWVGNAATPLNVVDGVLTGMHEPNTSHFHLLEAFAPRALLEAAWDHAVRVGYLGHEFGDATLVLS